MVKFMREVSAQKHMNQLKSEIGQNMDSVNERVAIVRDYVREQRAATSSSSYISFGLQEYHAAACARQAGIDHEAEQTRHKLEVSAQAQEQLVSFATSFFTIKNAMAQKVVDADKSFITGL